MKKTRTAFIEYVFKYDCMDCFKRLLHSLFPFISSLLAILLCAKIVKILETQLEKYHCPLLSLKVNLCPEFNWQTPVSSVSIFARVKVSCSTGLKRSTVFSCFLLARRGHTLAFPAEQFSLCSPCLGHIINMLGREQKCVSLKASR